VSIVEVDKVAERFGDRSKSVQTILHGELVSNLVEETRVTELVEYLVDPTLGAFSHRFVIEFAERIASLNPSV
jgi:hypothetical protein